jgi:catechol 2,3-dioxygenase-like lactoylglutathione lyase family enzyme
MTAASDGAKGASTESPPSSAGKPAAVVDIEAGKARAGLRAAAPVDARRLDHINMSVRDLEASAAFYAALFGLEVKKEGDSNGARWCIIGAPDRFYLSLNEVVRPEGFKAEGQRINHVGYVVDDIDQTVDRIRALGLRLEFGDKTVDWPRSRSAYVTDPDGVLIEITNRFGGGLG